MPSLAARPARNVQRPVGVRAVQVAVGRDHLRLEPDAELHTVFVYVFVDRFEAAGQLPPIDRPVAQRAVVRVAPPEPAVVDDQQLHAEVGRAVGDFLDARLVKAEIAGFPHVQQHRPPCVAEFPAAEVAAEGFVEAVRQAAQPVSGIAEHRLRRGEGRARLQRPPEAVGIQPDERARRAELRALGRSRERAGIDQRQPVGVPRRFGGLAAAEDEEGIMYMARTRPDGSPARFCRAAAGRARSAAPRSGCRSW